MDMKSLFAKIKSETDVDNLDITVILYRIPKLHCMLIDIWHQLGIKHNILNKQMDQVLGDRHRFFIEKSDRQIKSRTDRDIFISSEEGTSELKKMMADLKLEIETVEFLMKYLKDVKSCIEVRIDYQKFMAGR